MGDKKSRKRTAKQGNLPDPSATSIIQQIDSMDIDQKEELKEEVRELQSRTPEEIRAMHLEALEQLQKAYEQAFDKHREHSINDQQKIDEEYQRLLAGVAERKKSAAGLTTKEHLEKLVEQRIEDFRLRKEFEKKGLATPRQVEDPQGELRKHYRFAQLLALGFNSEFFLPAENWDPLLRAVYRKAQNILMGHEALDVQARISDANQRVRDAHEHVRQANRELVNRDEAINALESKLADKHRQWEFADAEMQAAIALREEKEKEFEKYKIETNEKLDALNAAIEQMNEEKKRLNNQLTIAGSQAHEKEMGLIAEREAMQAAFEKTEKAYKAEVERMKTEADKFRGVANTYADKNREFELELKGIKEEATKKQAEIIDLTGELSDEKEKNLALKEKVKKSAEQIQTLQEIVHESADELTALKKEKSSLEDSNVELTGANEGLQVEAKTAETEKKQYRTMALGGIAAAVLGVVAAVYGLTKYTTIYVDKPGETKTEYVDRFVEKPVKVPETYEIVATGFNRAYKAEEGAKTEFARLLQRMQEDDHATFTPDTIDRVAQYVAGEDGLITRDEVEAANEKLNYVLEANGQKFYMSRAAKQRFDKAFGRMQEILGRTFTADDLVDVLQKTDSDGNGHVTGTEVDVTVKKVAEYK